MVDRQVLLLDFCDLLPVLTRYFKSWMNNFKSCKCQCGLHHKARQAKIYGSRTNVRQLASNPLNEGVRSWCHFQGSETSQGSIILVHWKEQVIISIRFSKGANSLKRVKQPCSDKCISHSYQRNSGNQRWPSDITVI